MSFHLITDGECWAELGEGPPVRLIAGDAMRSPRPGGQGVLAKLAEVLFIEVLRIYMNEQAEGRTGWLAGVNDRIVGAALRALHAEPDRPWTLEDLARGRYVEVGAGRALFAATRFRGVEPGCAPSRRLAGAIRHHYSRVMATSSRPPVPIVMGSGSTETEESRAFFQSRLALFGQWIFVVSGVFLVIFGTIRLLFFPFTPALLLHALATLLAGLLWGLGWRARLTLPAMRVIDVVGTVLICASFGLMTLAYAQQMMASGFDPTPVTYVGLLATSFVLMARAIAIPGTAARTMWVGITVVLLLEMVDAVILSTANLLPVVRTMAFVEGALWKAAAVAMSSVASRVIFGLRQEVRQVQKLGQYTLEEKIGEGGMGVVYRARHAMLRRPTAIKLLPLEKAGDESVVRFEREVQLTAALSHPNTVAIFDYGRTADGIFYYAMEYLDGINLDHLVTLDGPQPAPRVVHVLRQVCGALAEAHEVGLVHRDVKPANIILCERGGMADVAKVVDFGLVKRFRPNDSEITAAATVQATLVGTPLYMAPECFSGAELVDARSDLYALGAVAYVLLTGTPVFSARSLIEVAAHHLHTPPEPPSARLGRPLPDGLEHLVLRCLAKSPADRPQCARELCRDLDRVAALDPWSDGEAATWWTGYRKTRAGEAFVATPGRPGS